MKTLLRSLLIFILISGLKLHAVGQEVMTINRLLQNDDQAETILYGVTDATVTTPDPAHTRFRPLTALQQLPSKNSGKALWRKIAIQSSDITEFIIDFGKHDFVDVFIFNEGREVDHLKTGYLIPSAERQVQSDNIARIQLVENENYDIYIRTEGVLNGHSTELTFNTLDGWMKDQQLTIMTQVPFLVFLLCAIGYTLFTYFKQRMKAYSCFSILLLSTIVFYTFSTGFLREFVLDGQPTLVRFFLCSILVMPFCYYRMIEQVTTAAKVELESQVLLKWTGYTNLAFFAICSLALINPDSFGIVAKVVRYVLIADAAVGAVVIVNIYNKRTVEIKYFFLGTVIMVAGLLLGTLLWHTPLASNLIIALTTVLHVPLSAYSLGIIGKSLRQKAQGPYVDERQEHQQMIERQKHDLATQIDELSQKLGGAMQEVEHSEKVKEDFLSIMSHEIRTPLNAIVGLTHLISREENIGEIKRNIGTLERSVDALLGLIDDVLDFNRMYTGQLQLDSIDFDLHETIKKIAKTYKLSAAQKDISFEFNFDPLIPIHVSGDSFRLTQVLDNLLSNAIKFTDEGNIRLTAKYCNREQGEKVRVRFEIEDSGIGIAPDDLTKIFDRFHEGDNDISRKYGESGLGLSIAKALISMMGSDFTVKSQQGGGSVISFVLEFERSGPEDKASRRMEQIDEGVPQGLRVLVVDDNEMNRMILNQFLNKWGIDADDAENGKEAFEKIVKNSYDLVLLDLQMPIMDGYELTKLIRSNDMLRDLPIIAISADSISNVYEKVTAAGMNDFIVKPLNPADLKQKIVVYSHNLQMHSIYSR